MNKYTKENEYIHEVQKSKAHLQTLIESGKGSYVYQYRNLDSFWNILESDSFWATNARFSNDHEEQKLGIQKVSDIVGHSSNINLQGDCYIVCFCDEDDKLSQWRGYAEEGVSMGFDLRNIRPYYIELGERERYLRVYNSCYKVQYIDENIKKYIFFEMFRLEQPQDENSRLYFEKKASNIIPYIKHSGFQEEEESRLVFSNDDGSLKNCIKYKKDGDLRIPYIVVRFGDDKKKRTCFVRANMSDEKNALFEQKLKNVVREKKLNNLKFVNCTGDDIATLDDRKCFGCTRRECYIPGSNDDLNRCRYVKYSSDNYRVHTSDEIYLSDSKNQEEMYYIVKEIVDEFEEFNDTKIWCEGHLPIRSIKIGSLKNKDIVRESIQHYCNNHYWLNYVKVDCSDTPYRSSLF